MGVVEGGRHQRVLGPWKWSPPAIPPTPRRKGLKNSPAVPWVSPSLKRSLWGCQQSGVSGRAPGSDPLGGTFAPSLCGSKQLTSLL